MQGSDNAKAALTKLAGISVRAVAAHAKHLADLKKRGIKPRPHMVEDYKEMLAIAKGQLSPSSTQVQFRQLKSALGKKHPKITAGLQQAARKNAWNRNLEISAAPMMDNTMGGLLPSLKNKMKSGFHSSGRDLPSPIDREIRKLTKQKEMDTNRDGLFESLKKRRSFEKRSNAFTDAAWAKMNPFPRLSLLKNEPTAWGAVKAKFNPFPRLTLFNKYRNKAKGAVK
tara:strand:- start:1522 stop:2199 length:678 start_codon:yes stop_codon:yes gene_type:complete